MTQTTARQEESEPGGRQQQSPSLEAEQDNPRLQQWEEFGHQFQAGELELLKKSIAEMALSRIDGQDELYVGGLWALRRSDSLTDRGITHVLSVLGFDPASLTNFKDQPWSEYGSAFSHLIIDVDDVEDADLLVDFPKAVKFIDQGLRGPPAGVGHHAHEVENQETGGASLAQDVQGLSLGEAEAETGEKDKQKRSGGVFVHCAAGKSRSVSAIIAYLLWRYPNRFDPNITPTALSDPAHAAAAAAAAAQATDSQPTNRPRSRKDTAQEAVQAALTFVRRTRPMADPNAGFMEQLALWWEMGCPDDVEAHHAYQRWAYKREVEENLAVGQAPTRLRFEDEEAAQAGGSGGESGLSLRCKKCRRTLVTAPFIVDHKPPAAAASACQHFFVEPLSWMRGALEKGELNGRLLCPNGKCGAGVGRYDWKGFSCSCGGWVTPAFSLQRARVDDVVKRPLGAAAAAQGMGIRMPPPGLPPSGGRL